LTILLIRTEHLDVEHKCPVFLARRRFIAVQTIKVQDSLVKWIGDIDRT